MNRRQSLGQHYSSGYGHGASRSPYAGATRAVGRDLDDYVDYIDEDHDLLGAPANRHQSFAGFRNHAVADGDIEPDIIHMRHADGLKLANYPPFSIAEAKVTVWHLRELAAEHANTSPSRIRLIYKEVELYEDDYPIKRYGCKQNSEVKVVKINDENYRSVHHSASDSERQHSDRRRNGGQNSTYRNDRSAYDDNNRDRDDRNQPQQRRAHASSISNGYLHPQGHHNHHSPTSSSSRQSSPADKQRYHSASQASVTMPAPTPMASSSSSASTARPRSPNATSTPKTSSQSLRNPSLSPSRLPPGSSSTPLGQIQKLRHDYHTLYVPSLDAFLANPPQNIEERNKEYRRCNEIVMQKIYGPGDALEAEGKDKEDIKATRRLLYAEVRKKMEEVDRWKPAGD